MHDHFPRWIETVVPEVTAEIVKTRAQLVDYLATDATIEGVLNLVRLLYRLPLPNTEFVRDLRENGQQLDPLFPMQNQDDHVAVLSGAACVAIMQDYDSIGNICAAAMVTAESAGHRISPCQSAFVVLAQQHLAQKSANLRCSRLDHSPLPKLPPMSKIEEEITTKVTEDQTEALKLVAKSLGTLSTMTRAHNRLLLQLRKSQRTFQEDSDILWWLMGRHCRMLNQPLDKLNALVAPVYLAFDLAELCNGLPGPLAAEAFLYHMLSHLDGKADDDHTISSIVSAVINNGGPKIQDVATEVRELGAICPLHLALAEAERTGSDAWHDAFENQVQIPVSTSCSALALSHQTFIERMLLNSLS